VGHVNLGNGTWSLGFRFCRSLAGFSECKEDSSGGLVGLHDEEILVFSARYLRTVESGHGSIGFGRFWRFWRINRNSSNT
jgi:hypothetical protein